MFWFGRQDVELDMCVAQAGLSVPSMTCATTPEYDIFRK